MTPLELARRHKVCACCNIEFCDITKRYVGKTCSTDCNTAMMVATRRVKGSYVRTDEQNKKLSTTQKQQYASGVRKTSVDAMLSVKWTSERVAKQQTTCKLKTGFIHWSQTDKGRDKISKIHKGKIISVEHRKSVSSSAIKRLATENQFSRCKRGKRRDLGDIFFRSAWEANYARILNLQNIAWEYEPNTFQLTETETYTPDFKLSSHEYVEIKGWWTDTSKRKIALFQAKYPENSLQIISRPEYIELSKQFQPLLGSNWEIT